MELVERTTFLECLNDRFDGVQNGVGHAAFVVGEAGIGKTTLLNSFLKEKEHESVSFVGACDSLFTPRPLGPLFDIADQIDAELADSINTEIDRAKIFRLLVQKLAVIGKPVVLVFEDVHWADEATLDLIKFLARRISRIPCLFIATYRYEEVDERHSLSSLFGEIPTGDYSKINLTRFSREVVESLANEAGWLNGQQLYELTSGNPFFVTEILTSGNHTTVPQRVKDSILGRFHTRRPDTKALWEFLSILVSQKTDPVILKYIESEFGNCMDECIACGIIISRHDRLSFHHELFRMTIEESLPSLKRKSLHKMVLKLLQQDSKDSRNLAHQVHHARLADEKSVVATLAPKAAQLAAAASAHREAAKLYATAIEYTDATGAELALLYESHAYESYLTYQQPAAIVSLQLALEIWRDLSQKTKEGNVMRFLSRLWWMKADHKRAVEFGTKAIETLEGVSPRPLRELALAYSNASQIAMLELQAETCLAFGNRAIEIATKIDDPEILSHALNNVGTAQLRTPAQERLGQENLMRSLDIALENGLQEHASRVYVNLSSMFMVLKKYDKALEQADLGIRYCNDNDVDLVKYYIVACKATVFLETGKWKEADVLVKQLMPNNQNVLVKMVVYNVTIRLALRRGEFEKAEGLLDEIEELAFSAQEIQRVNPVITARMELSWLRGKSVSDDEVKRWEATLVGMGNAASFYSDFLFWREATRTAIGYIADFTPITPVKLMLAGDWHGASLAWEKIGCPYERAIMLMRGDEKHQKVGLSILDELGAVATANRFRLELKSKGVRNIPSGPRESTLNNPAKLTDRQIDILILLGKGLPNKEIGEKLFISPKTVDNHISAILSKLGVNSRAKAVVESQRLGIVKHE